jgi:hypothetical protein
MVPPSRPPSGVYVHIRRQSLPIDLLNTSNILTHWHDQRKHSRNDVFDLGRKHESIRLVHHQRRRCRRHSSHSSLDTGQRALYARFSGALALLYRIDEDAARFISDAPPTVEFDRSRTFPYILALPKYGAPDDSERVYFQNS